MYCRPGLTDNENPVTGEIIQFKALGETTLLSNRLYSFSHPLSTITTEALKKCARNIQGGSIMKAMCRGKEKCVDFRDQKYTHKRNLYIDCVIVTVDIKFA